MNVQDKGRRAKHGRWPTRRRKSGRSVLEADLGMSGTSKYSDSLLNFGPTYPPALNAEKVQLCGVG